MVRSRARKHTVRKTRLVAPNADVSHFTLLLAGFVSFQEYAQQMALQAQKAETEAMYGNTKDANKAQALNDLYGDARKGNYKNQYAM
jgi:hypothetical protein